MRKFSEKQMDKISKILPNPDGAFVNIPGAYCANCGETFALYSYSADSPDGLDEGGRPYYKECPRCDNKQPDKYNLG